MNREINEQSVDYEDIEPLQTPNTEINSNDTMTINIPITSKGIPIIFHNNFQNKDNGNDNGNDNDDDNDDDGWLPVKNRHDKKKYKRNEEINRYILQTRREPLSRNENENRYSRYTLDNRTVMTGHHWKNEIKSTVKHNSGVYHYREYYHLASNQVGNTRFSPGDIVNVSIPVCSLIFNDADDEIEKNEQEERDKNNNEIFKVKGKIIDIDTYSVGKNEKYRLVNQYDIELIEPIRSFSYKAYTSNGKKRQLELNSIKDSFFRYVIGVHESQLSLGSSPI